MTNTMFEVVMRFKLHLSINIRQCKTLLPFGNIVFDSDEAFYLKMAKKVRLHLSYGLVSFFLII